MQKCFVHARAWTKQENIILTTIRRLLFLLSSAGEAHTHRHNRLTLRKTWSVSSENAKTLALLSARVAQVIMASLIWRDHRSAFHPFIFQIMKRTARLCFCVLRMPTVPAKIYILRSSSWANEKRVLFMVRKITSTRELPTKNRFARFESLGKVSTLRLKMIIDEDQNWLKEGTHVFWLIRGDGNRI